MKASFLNPSRLCALLLCLFAVAYGCGDGSDGGNAENIDSSLPISGATTAVEQPTSSTTAEVPRPSIINEIFPETSQIELFNRTSSPIDVSGFWVCHTTPEPLYARIPDNTVIEPEEFLIVNWGSDGNNSENEIFFPALPLPLNVEHGEFGLYKSFEFFPDNFADSNLLLDYVQWGEANHLRQGVAVGANLWPENAFVSSPSPGQSLSFTGVAGPGTGNTPDAWTHTTPTIGLTNEVP